jgi:hypothetical protein
MELRCTHQTDRSCCRSRLRYPASSPRYCTPLCTANCTQTMTPHSLVVSQLVQVSVSEWARGWAPLLVPVWVAKCMCLLPQHISASPHLLGDNPRQRCDGSSHTLHRTQCTPHRMARTLQRYTHLLPHDLPHNQLRCPASSPRCCTPSYTLHCMQTTTPRSLVMSQLVPVSVSEWAPVLVPMMVLVWVPLCMRLPRPHTSESPHLDASNPHHSRDASSCSPHHTLCTPQYIPDPPRIPHRPHCTHPHHRCQTRTPNQSPDLSLRRYIP